MKGAALGYHVRGFCFAQLSRARAYLRVPHEKTGLKASFCFGGVVQLKNQPSNVLCIIISIVPRMRWLVIRVRLA